MSIEANQPDHNLPQFHSNTRKKIQIKLQLDLTIYFPQFRKPRIKAKGAFSINSSKINQQNRLRLNRNRIEGRKKLSDTYRRRAKTTAVALVEEITN